MGRSASKSKETEPIYFEYLPSHEMIYITFITGRLYRLNLYSRRFLPNFYVALLFISTRNLNVHCPNLLMNIDNTLATRNCISNCHAYQAQQNSDQYKIYFYYFKFPDILDFTNRLFKLFFLYQVFKNVFHCLLIMLYCRIRDLTNFLKIIYIKDITDQVFLLVKFISKYTSHQQTRLIVCRLIV